MKQSLLVAMFSAAAMSMGATGPATFPGLVKTTGTATVRTAPDNVKTSTTKLAPGVFINTTAGLKNLRVERSEAQRYLRVPSINAPEESTLPDGYVLFEGFEGWDKTDAGWVPDGWTVEGNDGVATWTPETSDPYLPGPAEGDCYFAINYDTNEQDEWLISPYVTVEEGMDLSYWLYLDPQFLFNLDDVDWDSMTFNGEPQVSANLQIYARPEGEDWILLRDYFEEYKDYSLLELLYMSPDALQKHTVSLEEFSGKKICVGFRYVGIDGNTMFIDAIGIGYPALEGIAYVSPYDTLYWGLDKEFKSMPQGIAQYPVYSPIIWSNYDVADNVSYSWTYIDPETGEETTDDADPYDLSVTYFPDYSSPERLRNNLYYPPKLTATTPNVKPADYTAPYARFQAGGKAEYVFPDNAEFEGCLFPFDCIERELSFTAITDDAIGAIGIPVFGYDKHVDEYWHNYSTNWNAEDKYEGDFNHLLGIANLFMPSAPIVINGINVFGFGMIADDVELRATIYGISPEMTTDFNTLEVIATTTITGKDIVTNDRSSKEYLCLPFAFDTPVVIAPTEEHPAYFIMLEGFHSDKVEYFAPLQASKDDEFGICWGYMFCEVNLEHASGRPKYYNIKPMVYRVDGEYVDPASAFAIGLDAEYPWLTSDDTTLEVFADSTPVEATLRSYYKAAQLTVTAPTGVIAKLTDTGDKLCTLTLSHDDTEVIAEGDVVVKGPGVELTISVTQGVNAVDAVRSDSSDITGIYDLTGRRIDAKEGAKGVFIVKYSDGHAEKVTLK